MLHINSKADLKRKLKDALTDGTLVSSQVQNSAGNVLIDNAPAPVVKAQTNGVAMLRDGKESWIRFDQKDEIWMFNNSDTITVVIGPNRRFVIKLHPKP